MNAKELLGNTWGYVKQAVGYSGGASREKLQETLVTEDPTQGYHANRFYDSSLLVNQLPLYTLFTGRMMVDSDPIVEFALNVRNAALMVAEVEIKAKNGRVQQWLDAQWNTIWELNRRQVVATKKWGFAGLQPTYKINPSTKLLDIDGLKDFAPEDVRALESGGKQVGFRVKDRKLFGPRSLWLTFNTEYGSPYGRGSLRRMYPPWYEKWMDRGAKKLIQQRMIKDAYVGDIFWVPFNLSVELPDGRQVPWRDLARQVAENRMSGGAMTLPMFRDDKGNRLMEYEPPQSIAGGTDTFAWKEGLDEDILRGADIPIEVIKASETGSGYSGRSIPFMVLLSVCTGEFVEYVKQVQELLRVVAWLNFGGDPEFEMKPKSLVESFAGDAAGSPMGGGAIGGQPGQAGAGGGQGGMRPGMQQQGPPQPPPQPQRFSDEISLPEVHEFSSTQFNLPGELSFDLRRMADRINYDDLAGDGRELNPHITIKYGLHTNNADDVRAAVEGEPPVAVTLGKTSVFSGAEHDVVKIEIESEALRRLNAKISSSLTCTDAFPEYKPHCTIAYVKPGLGERYAAVLNDLQGKVAVFDRLVFSNKLRQWESIPLTGTAQFSETRFDEGFEKDHPRNEDGEFTEKGELWKISKKDHQKYIGKKQFDAITSMIVKGNPVVHRNPRFVTKLDSVDQVRLTKSGNIEIMQRGKFVALPPHEVLAIAKQAGFKEGMSHFDAVYEAYTKGLPVPDDILAEYPAITEQAEEEETISDAEYQRRKSLTNKEYDIEEAAGWPGNLDKSTRFDLSGDTSTLDEITAIGTAAARRRILTAAERIADLAKKKSDLSDPTTFEGLGKFELLADIRALLEDLHRGISSDLQSSMIASSFAGAAEVAVGIPPAHVPPVTTAAPPAVPPAPPTIASFFPDDPSPGLRFPVIDDALAVLHDAEIFTSDDYREVAEQAKAGAFAITSTLGDEAVADIRDLLQENIAKGPDLEGFVEAVQERLREGGPLSERHIETIFRTNVSSSFSNGANKSLESPMVVDAFPYRAYWATTDRRVRKNHIALETLGLQGTNIYRADDPTWLKFRPPWEFNCRCTWSPVTVEQAAKAGVVEAQEWLARAKEAAKANGGTWPEWLNKTAPMQRAWVAVPGFEPPAEFRR
jgi:SPP1 gp7 family putative phage head morphogenesis protein